MFSIGGIFFGRTTHPSMRCSGPTTTSTPSICRTLIDKYKFCVNYSLYFLFGFFVSFNISRRDKRGTTSYGKKETRLATTGAQCFEDETGLALAKHTTDAVFVLKLI